MPIATVVATVRPDAGCSGGPAVTNFEADFAKFLRIENVCIGVKSGTDALRFALTAAGTKTSQAGAYKTGDFPVTERVTPEIVSMPMFPYLTAEQQQTVVKAVLAYVGEKAGVAAGRG